MKHWIFLAIAIVGQVVIANSALKASDGFMKPLPSVMVVVGYGGTFDCFSLALKKIPVGIVPTQRAQQETKHRGARQRRTADRQCPTHGIAA